MVLSFVCFQYNVGLMPLLPAAQRLRLVSLALLASWSIHHQLSVTFPCSAPLPQTNKKRFIRATAARGGASFRSADAAQVCNNVGFSVFDGVFECSPAPAARQTVSERWREGGGLKHLSLAATSAFDSTKRRQTSRQPSRADQCSAVH